MSNPTNTEYANRNINQITIEGGVVQDPQTAPNKPNEIRLCIANNDDYKDVEGKVHKNVNFINIIARGYVGKKALTLKKGSRIVVVGKIEQYSYAPKDSEKKLSYVNVIASDISLSINASQSSSNGNGNGRSQAPSQSQPQSQSREENTIPSGFDDVGFDDSF